MAISTPPNFTQPSPTLPPFSILTFSGQAKRNWEISDAPVEETVAGNIHKAGQFWHNQLDASKFVLNIVDNGYRLPFAIPCPPFLAKNNASSLNHKDFVSEAILKLVKQKCAKEVFQPPFCCNPLTVASGKKLRLVLDLRHVNAHLQKFPFRYENLKTVAKIFEQGFFFATFDLKSGYHHIAIHKDDVDYLGFAWEFNGSTRYFVFLVLPFGLSTASYVFTKTLRPFIKKWRGQGIRCAIYIDDGIQGSPTKKATAYNCLTMREDLEGAGFMLNGEKSCLYPSQTGEWLGFTINTATFTFAVPHRKLQKLLLLAKKEASHKRTTARSIAKIAGQIISMEPGIGPLTRLFTRKMYSFVDACPSWDGGVPLSGDVRQEITFWKENINDLNGFQIKHTHAFSKIVYSDASEHGYGGYIAEKLGDVIARGSFTHQEKGTSSTFRELLAVKNIILSLSDQLRHEAVLWYSDNWNVARILEVGSPKDHLQDLALDIFALRLKHDIKIIPSWIPREENQLADAISKFKDTDDWGIDFETFNYIQEKFGPLEIDRFADPDNAKLARFDARFHSPGCETVNTFTSNWAPTFNWWCPPICLIADTLKHARLCQASGVLLIPEWPSAYFWPLLTPDGKNFEDFVKDFLLLDPCYISTCERSVFKGHAPFRSLALLIRF